MTMLDRMRRHKNWLKWSLALVVLAFIALYIPATNNSANGAGMNDALATVEGSDVTVGQFRRAYARQMEAYRSAYGASMDERLLRQLQIDQRIVQQLVEEEISIAEARRLGINATDEEVKGRILAIPSFQENGQFIGYDRYRQMLQMQNPPVRESDFEEQVRRSITVEKLQAALTNWISIPDAEIETEFRKRNEKVKLAVVNFPADKFREGAQASDDEIAAWFEKSKDTYRIPEKRKVKYALLDVQAIRERTTVAPQQVQRYYEDNAQQYATPEQVRASHVLLKTDGKNEADVKKLAEEIAAKAKGGADFAALAKQYLGRRLEQGQRRGSRLLRQGRDGAGVRPGRLRHDARPGERPGQDVLRLPRDQDGGKARRHVEAPGRSPGADRRSAQMAAGPGRRPADL